MAPRVRPLQVGDLAAVAALDRAYAAALGVAPAVSRASVHYYQRTGHSFVAEHRPQGAGAPVVIGFALAHPSWSGADAVVRLERLGVADGTPAEAARAASALAAAVVKSAYDAGVYRLTASVPAADAVAREALDETMFAPDATVSYARLLGSGALSGAATAEPAASGGEHDRS